MDQISQVTVEEHSGYGYISPCRLNYVQNGEKKSWDLVIGAPGVCCLIFNVSRKVLVLVKQFRPAVYFSCIPSHDRVVAKPIDMDKYPAELGIMLELCGGMVDKNKSLAQITREEVLEECGYDVPIEKLQLINTTRRSVGIHGYQMHTYYCEVDDTMKVSQGGGLPEEGELIEVVEMTIDQAKEYIKRPVVNSIIHLLYALMWFLNEKSELVNSR